MGCSDWTQLGRVQIIDRSSLQVIHVEKRYHLLGHYVNPFWKDHTLCGRNTSEIGWTFKFVKEGNVFIHCRRCVGIALKGRVKNDRYQVESRSDNEIDD